MSASSPDAVARAKAVLVRAYGLDDPAHKPEPRGVSRLVDDLEAAVDTIAEEGGYSLFVVRVSDLEAVKGLQKIVTWARKARQK